MAGLDPATMQMLQGMGYGGPQTGAPPAPGVPPIPGMPAGFTPSTLQGSRMPGAAPADWRQNFMNQYKQAGNQNPATLNQMVNQMSRGKSIDPANYFSGANINPRYAGYLGQNAPAAGGKGAAGPSDIPSGGKGAPQSAPQGSPLSGGRGSI